KTDRKILRLQSRPIFFHVRKVPRVHGGPVNAASIQCAGDRSLNCGDASVPAEFSYKTAAGPERASDGCDDRVRTWPPMPRCVAENRVKLSLEAHGFAVHNPRIDSSGPGRAD